MSGTVTDGSPDNNHAAASGNHGTDGGGGFATANSDGTFMRVDGEEDWEIDGVNLIPDTESEWESTSIASDSAYGVYKTGLTNIFSELVNKDVSVLFEVYLVNAVNTTAGFRLYGTNGSPKYRVQNIVFTDIETNKWVIVTGTSKVVEATANTGQARIEFYGEDNPNTTKIKIRKFKMVKGNKPPLTWSPAPEDMDNVPSDGEPINFDKLELMTYNNVTNKANINLQTGERNRIDYIETVKYTFEHNRMAIEVELEALEDFYINWYMGLQITRPGWNYDAYFNRDLEKTKLYIQDNAILNSGTKGNSPQMQRATMRNNKGDVIHVMLDNEYGIGYSKIRDTDPICYLRDSFQKFYFHLVKNNNVLIVPKGEKVKYRGAYIFGKNKAKNATNVTYFTENGIKKAYVDFKVIATESIDYTSVEESFNCIFDGNNITSTEPNAYAKLIL